MPAGARGKKVKPKTPTRTEEPSPHTPQRTYKSYEHIEYSYKPPISAKHALQIRKHALQIRKQPDREAKHTHPGFYSSPKTPTYSKVLQNMRAKSPHASGVFPNCKRRLVY